jgi:conjugal transfer pilus assembly protein TraE
MDIKTYRGQVSNAFAANTFLKLMLSVLLVSNVFLGVALLATAGSGRTIIVPPEIERSFWVERDQVSKEYLEQMAAFIAQLHLNVTPSTYDYQSEAFLRYVHPSVHGEMRARLLSEGQQLRNDGASTWFSPGLVRTDVAAKQVAVTGDFHVTVAQKEIVREQKTYLLDFTMSGNRMFLVGMKEVPEAELFKTPDEKQSARAASEESG